MGHVALTDRFNSVMAFQNHVCQILPPLLKVFLLGCLLGTSPSALSSSSVPVDRPFQWVQCHGSWCQ